MVFQGILHRSGRVGSDLSIKGSKATTATSQAASVRRPARQPRVSGAERWGCRQWCWRTGVQNVSERPVVYWISKSGYVFGCQ